jgi:2-oxoglutarate decarboxylase
MNIENLSRHIAERIVADFGANTEFAIQELEKYQADPASVGSEWQTYFAWLLTLPAAQPATTTTPEPEAVVADVHPEPMLVEPVTMIEPMADATPSATHPIPRPKPSTTTVPP